MERGTGKEAGTYLQAAACDIQDSDWSMATTHERMGTLSVGLSQQQRKRVLAGSDPLVADLLLAMDLLDDAVMVVHEDGRVIHYNHVAAALALPVKAHAIHSLHLLGPGEPWAASRQILREYQTSSGWLEREVHDPGTGRSWALRLTALHYLGVFPRRLVLLVRDITVAVNTRRRLEEREVMAATGALLAGAAHQTKNAIFGLSATLDAFEARLTRRFAGDHEYVGHLRAGIDRMQLLMRDLLDYGNPTVCAATPVSIAAVVQQSVSACQELAKKTRNGFVLEMAEDAEVVANPARLTRALENLLENALQHSPQGAPVTIQLTRAHAGRMLRLEVVDQGPGFPPEHMEKLFTPFFTLRPGGTGLGLTIAKKIVEDLGGTIQLSNGEAGEARATVLLPVHADNVSELRNQLNERVHGGE